MLSHEEYNISNCNRYYIKVKDTMFWLSFIEILAQELHDVHQ